MYSLIFYIHFITYVWILLHTLKALKRGEGRQMQKRRYRLPPKERPRREHQCSHFHKSLGVSAEPAQE